MDASEAGADGQVDEPVVVDLGAVDAPAPQPQSDAPTFPKRRTPALVGVLVGLAALAAWVVGGGADSSPELEPDDPAVETPRSQSDRDREAGGVVERRVVVPPALRSAEAFVEAPSRDTLRDLFVSIGGWEGVEIGVAEGAFDLVTFDPDDGDRLLASQRRGYGPAQNQGENQVWRVQSGEVAQQLWNPDQPHDFVHFNTDASMTMWTHGGGEAGFAPRQALVVEGAETPRMPTAAMYADRFAVDAGVVFALTGYPDWYSSGEGYVSLVADDGATTHELAPGDDFVWLDVPVPGLLVAYPADATNGIALWSTETLEPLPEHPLAGRPLERLAISGDRATAIAVTAAGELAAFDLRTGETRTRFGRVDIEGVERPIAVAHDGTVAITVEASGEVSIWWVGDDTPAATLEAGSGLARWVPSTRSARVTSAVSPDARRVAVQRPARAQTPVSWSIVETDTASWISRACSAAADGLAEFERVRLAEAIRPGLCVAG